MDESIAKVNNGATNFFSSVRDSLEVTLNDKKRKYFDKIQALLTAWEQIVNFVSISAAESPQRTFDFLFLNTLRFVLRADWPRSSVATQTHLTVTLQRFSSVLAKSENYHSILEQCRILESVVKNPWGHTVLCKILNSQEVDLNECVDYFNFENGKVIVVRLEMLLQSKCEDIAVHLSKACLNTYNNFNEDLEGFDTLDFNQDEIDYITDIYFSSLLKTKKKSELISEIKKYQLDDGLRLLQRYRKDGVGGKYKENCLNARVWKCNKKLIDLLSNTLLANAVLNENLLESQSQLEELILEWAAVQTINDVLPPLALEMIRKFVLIAPSSKCIYPFCSFLIRNGSCKNHDINQVARCLIRAINQNMNEVEQYRVKQERDKLKETYNQLSKGFLLISELFTEYKNIYKECLLTSFSLTPSRECLQTMEEFIARLATVVETSECDTQAEKPTELATLDETSDKPHDTSDKLDDTSDKLDDMSDKPHDTSDKLDDTSDKPHDISDKSHDTPNKPHDTSDKPHDTSELNEIFQSIGMPENDVSAKQIDANIIKPVDFMKNSTSASAPAYVSEIEELNLEDSLRVDLNCILRYQRYYTLNWDLEWDELKKNCEQYLEDFEKKGFDDVELKYLILDYNQFKDQPLMYDDCGIEKGYEQFAISPADSEEEYSNKRSGPSSYDSDDDVAFGSKKRKKVNSEGDELRNKKKRGRKTKPDEKPARKSSTKKKKDSEANEDESRVLDVINQRSDPNSLKELRKFRIAGLKTLNGNQRQGKSYDDNHNESEDNVPDVYLELNSILEDSFKELESVDLTPLSPRFNVYDEILDHTLVPSDCEIRLPKCEDLVNNENLCINQHIQSIENIKASSEKPAKKPKPVANRERNPVPRKRTPKTPGEAKPRAKPRPKVPKEPYKNGATFNNHHTLLGNDQLFRKIYGTKPKNGNVFDSNAKLIEELTNGLEPSSYLKDCVVELPKLKDTFSHVNTAKNVLAMKPIDHNVNFSSSYLNNSFSSMSKKINNEPAKEYSGNFVRTQPPQRPVNSENTNCTVQTYTSTEKTCDNFNDIDNIEILLRQIVGETPEYTPQYPTNVDNTSIYKNSNSVNSSNVRQAANGNGELEQMLYDFMKDDSPEHRMYGSDTNQTPPKPKVTQVFESPKTVPSDGLVNTAAATASSQGLTMTTGTLYNAPLTNATSKRNEFKVHEILGQYRDVIDKYPHLQNVPAPRKRTSNANPSSKRRPRAKKNAQALSIEEALKNESLLSTSSASDYTQLNTHSNLSDNSKSKLPPYVAPADGSSHVAKSSMLKTQLTNSVAFQRSTGTQTNKNTRSPNTNQLSYSANQVNNGARYHISADKSINACANGTLKSLLLQGSSTSLESFDPSPYGHVYSSSTDTQVHSQMPVASNETRNFVTPRTYGQSNQNLYENSNVAFNNAQYSTPNNGYQVLNTNVPVSVAKLNELNMNHQNAYAYPIASTSNTVMANDNGVSQVSYADTLAVSDLLANVQVCIPRIDIKMDPSKYNKPNFYVDEQSKANVNSTPINDLQNIHENNTVPNNAISNAPQVSQTFSTNNFNQFQPTCLLSDIGAGFNNELKMPVLFATVSDTSSGEMNSANEVCISIPESAYSEEYLESYLTFIQST